MISRPGHNVWRVERAERASVLIDGAAYFRAVREALLRARRSVFVVGWDIHSRTRLVGESGRADDGYPERLADFLSALVRERPELAIHLLLWDYSVLYAAEREPFPTLTLRWNTPRRVCFCLDDAVPFGASQHQKLIVIDDAVAFSGGLDVTIRRWDTPAHRRDHPQRVDNAGRPYRPFHDVQALVDGQAAAALAQLARARWRAAACGELPPFAPGGDPWPQSVAADFTGARVAIARTQPRYDGDDEVREVEQLFLDAIDAAERTIYIENQFLTRTRVTERLAQRLRECPSLEVVIVCPKSHDSWLESKSMRSGRIRFARLLYEQGVAARARLFYPEVRDRTGAIDVMVHSKVMIVDDRILRIGSANLNNRSLGTDTECDLAIEAESEAQRARIAQVRARLLGEHCGASAEAILRAHAETGSLIAVAENLSCDGHRLLPAEDGTAAGAEPSTYIDIVGDPEHPIGAEEFVSMMFGGHVRPRQVPMILKVCAIAALLLLLALVWHWTPLAQLADPQRVRDLLTAFARGPSAPLVTVAAFVVGGLVAFPVLILIAATAAAFGAWEGLAYAATGTLVSAAITYALGARLGKESLRDVVGPRLDRVREQIVRRGVLAIAAIRMVPIAPFTVVNLVAGASEIPFVAFMAGTALGMAPGIIVMTALGHQLASVLLDPSAFDYALLVGAVLAWVALTIGLQALIARVRSGQP